MKIQSFLAGYLEYLRKTRGLREPTVLNMRKIINLFFRWFEANIKGRVTPHNLRHTCGTELYRATGDIVKVAKYLGHASTYTTTRVYVTLATEDLAKIAQNHPIYELLKELRQTDNEEG